MKLLAALIAGILFGLGLAVSGMANPKNVLAFLTLGPSWNPALLLVMVSAIIVTSVGYFLARRRPTPLLDATFHMPSASHIDGRLVIGSAVFGLGWGLAGYCPGPSIVGAFQLDSRALAFLAMFLIGLLGYEVVQATLARRAAPESKDG
ncbi:MAG: DUF6691 family protein [Halioglobus sp.]